MIPKGVLLYTEIARDINKWKMPTSKFGHFWPKTLELPLEKKSIFGRNTKASNRIYVSLGANLSKTYRNYCVRATAITLWSDSCTPARHIMSISGHINEQSLASYNRRLSTSQLKNCSDILSTALQNGQAPLPNAITQLSARPYSASTSSVSVMAPKCLTRWNFQFMPHR